jgi:hypothetical protein
VGLLFGMTMEVDMDFTRKNKVLRIKIGCVDHTLIPPSFDVFIRRGFFKLLFKVESDGVQNIGNLFDDNNNDNDDADGADDTMEEEEGKEADMELDPNSGTADHVADANEAMNKGGDANMESEQEAQPMVAMRFGAFVSHIPLSGNNTTPSPINPIVDDTYNDASVGLDGILIADCNAEYLEVSADDLVSHVPESAAATVPMLKTGGLALDGNLGHDDDGELLDGLLGSSNTSRSSQEL